MLSALEAEGCARLHGRRIDVDRRVVDVVELVVQNFTTERDGLGDHMLITRAHEVTIFAAARGGIGLRIAACSIEQPVADLVTTTQFQTPDTVDARAGSQSDVSEVVISARADDPLAKIIIITEHEAADEVIAIHTR